MKSRFAKVIKLKLSAAALKIKSKRGEVIKVSPEDGTVTCRVSTCARNTRSRCSRKAAR